MSDFLETRRNHRVFNDVVLMLDKLSKMLDDGLFWFSNVQRRPDGGFVDYQQPGGRVERPFSNDRVYPLETVELQRFNATHDADLNRAMIHTGPYADEFARSFNAFALTVGEDIFFRNNAFGTGSEESRKTLAHELAHVSQHSEKRITKWTSGKELEEEAEQSERAEAYDTDPFVTVNFGGKDYRVRKSDMGEYAYNLSANTEKWIREQRLLMDEEEYLTYLCAIKGWLEEGT